MRRIRVVGNSGSGKTHLSRQLGNLLGLPVLELDEVHHGPGWVEVPDPQFRARVQKFLVRSEAKAGGWIVDGNYRSRLGEVVDAADAVVWLNYPRWFVMQRMLRRTFGRMVRRTELWHGNRERLREVLSRDPERSIVMWAWTQHEGYRCQYQEESQQAAGTTWIRLRSPMAARRLLRQLGPDLTRIERAF